MIPGAKSGAGLRKQFVFLPHNDVVMTVTPLREVTRYFIESKRRDPEKPA